jgi:hypothetical protein
VNIQDLKRFAGKIQKGRLLPLLRAAAESLVGQPVEVNLRQPVFKDFCGHVYRTRRGLAMDLDPIVGDLERFFFTFLHEVGHLYLGHCEGQEPFFEDMVPVELREIFQRRGVEMPQLFRDAYEADEDGREAQAHDFARYFGEYARQKAQDELGSVSVQARLQILSNTRIIPEVC